MYGAILLFALLAQIPCDAQMYQQAIRFVPHKAKEASGFAISGYTVLDTAAGDINGDGFADIAIVLRDNDPQKKVADTTLTRSEPYNKNPFMLVVGIWDSVDNGYDRIVANDQFIPVLESNFLPAYNEKENNLSISKGVISITTTAFATMGTWNIRTSTLKFRLYGTCCRLIGAEITDTDRASGTMESVSANYQTGKVKFTTSTIGSTKEKITWKKLSGSAPPCLHEMVDALAFEPQIQ